MREDEICIRSLAENLRHESSENIRPSIEIWKVFLINQRNIQCNGSIIENLYSKSYKNREFI